MQKHARFLYTHYVESVAKAINPAIKVIESFVKQLLGNLGEHIPDGLRNLILRLYAPKSARPGLIELTERVLLPLVELFPSSIFILDGLDECAPEGEERYGLLRAMKAIIEHGAKVFLSCREDVQVQNFISGTVSVIIDKHNSNIQHDLLTFIQERLDMRMQERKITDDLSTMESIRSTLSHKADAM